MDNEISKATGMLIYAIECISKHKIKESRLRKLICEISELKDIFEKKYDISQIVFFVLLADVLLLVISREYNIPLDELKALQSGGTV